MGNNFGESKGNSGKFKMNEKDARKTKYKLKDPRVAILEEIKTLSKE